MIVSKNRFCESNLFFRASAERKLSCWLLKHGELSSFLMKLLPLIRTSGGFLYLVGGSVRDIIEGVENIKDIDLMASGISYETLEAALISVKCKGCGVKGVLSAGKNFPVFKLSVSWNKEPLDVALSRRERSVGSGHRDFIVTSEDISAFEDSGRRDFTFNSIFYRFFLRKGRVSGVITDYRNGLNDLKMKKISAVGDPYERFMEDPLRMLRAVRQKNQRQGFYIEDSTSHAIRELVPPLLKSISRERIAAELERSFEANPSESFKDFLEYGVLSELIPEIFDIENLDQNYYYSFYKELSAKLYPLQSFVSFALLLSSYALREWECSSFELKGLKTIVERLLFPGQKIIVNFLRSFVTLVNIDDYTYPYAVAENALSPSFADELIVFWEIYLRMNSLRTIISPSFLSFVRESPFILCGLDLKKLGIPQGKHMGGILLAVRNSQLNGKIKDKREASLFALELYRKITDRS